MTICDTLTCDNKYLSLCFGTKNKNVRALVYVLTEFSFLLSDALRTLFHVLILGEGRGGEGRGGGRGGGWNCRRHRGQSRTHMRAEYLHPFGVFPLSLVLHHKGFCLNVCFCYHYTIPGELMGLSLGERGGEGR